MLAELWDAKAKREKLYINQEAKKTLKQFFLQEKNNRQTFDYHELIRKLHTVFEDNRLTYFVEELNDLNLVLYESETYTLAQHFFEQLKKQLNERYCHRTRRDHPHLPAGGRAHRKCIVGMGVSHPVPVQHHQGNKDQKPRATAERNSSIRR